MEGSNRKDNNKTSSDADNKNQWSFFANQHALVTSALLFLGGVIALVGQFNWWGVGIYSLVIGVVVLILEYPRSAKPNSNQGNQPRPKQHILGNFFKKSKFLYENFFPRCILYLVLGIPCLITLSTLIPGLNLLIVSILYLISTIKREKWIPIEVRGQKYTPKIAQPPIDPPPRSVVSQHPNESIIEQIS